MHEPSPPPAFFPACRAWACGTDCSAAVAIAQDYKKAGADQYVFHLEAIVGEPVTIDSTKNQQVMDVIEEVKAAGMYVGIALKPATPVEALYPYIEDIDMVRPPSFFVCNGTPPLPCVEMPTLTC